MAIDANHDGFIDKSEMKAAFEKKGNKALFEKYFGGDWMVKSGFAFADNNDDGKLSFDEVKEYFNISSIMHVFEMLDADKSGSIKTTEWIVAVKKLGNKLDFGWLTKKEVTDSLVETHAT